MAETGGLTARCLRAARRLLPAGVRRESGELARLAGPVVRAGTAGLRGGERRGARGGGGERTELSAELFRCSEPLRCRPHLPASTDGAHPFAITQRGTFLPSRPSPSAGGALGARAFLLVWAENPSKPMLCVLSPPSLLGDGDRAEHLRCPH